MFIEFIWGIWNNEVFFSFSFIDKLYMGPGQLYQDLQNLIHDLGLVNQIAGMIGSLKGNYQVLYTCTKLKHKVRSEAVTLIYYPQTELTLFHFNFLMFF